MTSSWGVPAPDCWSSDFALSRSNDESLIPRGVVARVRRRERQRLRGAVAQQRGVAPALAIDGRVERLSEEFVRRGTRAVLRLHEDQVRATAVLMEGRDKRGVLRQPGDVTNWRRQHQVNRARFQLRDHGLRICENLDLDAVEVRSAGLPVVRVFLQSEVVALGVVREREGSGTGGSRRSGSLEGDRIDDAEERQRVEDRGPGAFREQHGRVLVGGFDASECLRHPVVEAAAGDFRVAADATDIPRDVIRRQLAARVPLDAFAQMQRDARVFVVDIPALDENAFRIELRVELDQAIPDRVDGALTVEEVAVERWQVAESSLAQDAASARLVGRRGRLWRDSLRRRRGGRGWAGGRHGRHRGLAGRHKCHCRRDAEQTQSATSRDQPWNSAPTIPVHVQTPPHVRVCRQAPRGTLPLLMLAYGSAMVRLAQRGQYERSREDSIPCLPSLRPHVGNPPPGGPWPTVCSSLNTSSRSSRAGTVWFTCSADELGFDWIGCAEHLQLTRQPGSNVSAVAASDGLHRAGRTLRDGRGRMTICRESRRTCAGASRRQPRWRS